MQSKTLQILAVFLFSASTLAHHHHHRRLLGQSSGFNNNSAYQTRTSGAVAINGGGNSAGGFSINSSGVQGALQSERNGYVAGSFKQDAAQSVEQNGFNVNGNNSNGFNNNSYSTVATNTNVNANYGGNGVAQFNTGVYGANVAGQATNGFNAAGDFNQEVKQSAVANGFNVSKRLLGNTSRHNHNNNNNNNNSSGWNSSSAQEQQTAASANSKTYGNGAARLSISGNGVAQQAYGSEGTDSGAEFRQATKGFASNNGWTNFGGETTGFGQDSVVDEKTDAKTRLKTFGEGGSQSMITKDGIDAQASGSKGTEIGGSHNASSNNWATSFGWLNNIKPRNLSSRDNDCNKEIKALEAQLIKLKEANDYLVKENKKLRASCKKLGAAQ